ncbi:MAG: stalk domain-containing protein [Candidatus Eremiobacteraeota bacterium]|nr:stalk domain-containing protein [Candidatus Eremiobacteraeota bacterium]
MLALPAAISIALNGHSLPIAAVEAHDRVLVPMRPLFEALGARISYDNRSKTIRATNGTGEVSFAVGERGSRLVGSSTYVPLRFVATSLGARVAYEAAKRLVTVDSTVTEPTRASATAARRVIAVTPANNASVASAFPTITATIDRPSYVNFGTIRLAVDGADVTGLASYSATSISYIPRRGFTVGSHVVALTGITSDGNPLREVWSFITTLPALQSTGAPAGAYGYFGGLHLSVAGSVFGPNQYVPVQLVAPPGGQAYAFVCNSPYQFPMYAPPSSSYYSATLPPPSNNALGQCPITAMYVSPAGQIMYAPYPVYVSFQPFTSTPVPARTPVPAASPTPLQIRHLPGPVQTRAPGTPVPVMATPQPKAVLTPHPVSKPVYREPEPQPRPRPRPTPASRRLLRLL